MVVCIPTLNAGERFVFSFAEPDIYSKPASFSTGHLKTQLSKYGIGIVKRAILTTCYDVFLGPQVSIVAILFSTFVAGTPPRLMIEYPRLPGEKRPTSRSTANSWSCLFWSTPNKVRSSGLLWSSVFLKVDVYRLLRWMLIAAECGAWLAALKYPEYS